MPNRPFFFGLLLGLFAAFRLRLPKPAFPDRDFFADPLIVSDRTGAVTKTNAAARALFGVNTLPPLHYPTGQAVAPGQHPLQRATESRETVSGRYHLAAADGAARVLDITARPLPSGGAVAVFREVTALHESNMREKSVQTHRRAVSALSRRLSRAQTLEEISRAAAEEVCALLTGLPDVQIRLYSFDPQADTLTCLASAPDDRPQRSRSAAQTRPAPLRFHAQVPELWQLYVARQPAENSLPLIAGGIAIGHLFVTSAAGSVFEDDLRRETLETMVSVTALALAGPASAAQAAALAAQAAAMREIVSALHGGSEPGELADQVAAQIKRLLGADVCTVSVPVDGTLTVLGKLFEDDLLFPKTAPGDARLHGKAVRSAHRTQKVVAQTGIANPDAERGPWRAFAGSSGCHSVTALPLLSKRGVLAVYTRGDAPLPGAQVKFLETVAGLLSLRFAPATVPAGGADLPASQGRRAAGRAPRRELTPRAHK